MRRVWTAVVVTMWVAACDGTESTNPPISLPGPGPGMVVCATDEDCQPQCQGYLEQVTGPGVDRSFTEARCDLINGAPGCDCALSASSSLTLTPSNGACQYFGRAHDCLYALDEVPACTVGEDASCEAACTLLEQRIADDNARIIDASIRAAACLGPRLEADGYGDFCGCVIEIGAVCHLGRGHERHDCSRSDAELLELARTTALMPMSYPPCSEVDRSDGGPGTCIDDTPGS